MTIKSEQFVHAYRSEILVCLILIISIFSVYGQIKTYPFISLDDNAYIYKNEVVRGGISYEAIQKAFSFYLSNKEGTYWQPLTWLSHMTVCHFFGLNAGRHHLISLGFHILNTLLLFWVLRGMTLSCWKSALVAALFAFHPINVDSVVWAAELKNLLSSFFWLLTMLAYFNYVHCQGGWRYFMMVLFFILGLLAKPMLVTLPCVFLLLDYWPLGRFQLTQGGGTKNACPPTHTPQLQPAPLSYLIIEKIPLVVIAVISVLISTYSLKNYGNIITTDFVPISLRINNAIVSYVRYLGKFIYPVDFAIYYPFPQALPLSNVIMAALLLALISAVAWYTRKSRPYLAVGWLWFLGTLVPVIGLKQPGLWPAIADRFAYIPFIGLFIMAAWGMSDLLARSSLKKMGIGLSLLGVLALMTITWKQSQFWADDVTLFKHTIEVTENNAVVHKFLGNVFLDRQKPDEALTHFSEAARIAPFLMENAEFQSNMGVCLLLKGKNEAALSHFLAAIRVDPQYAKAQNNIAYLYAAKGEHAKAVTHLRKALAIDPNLSKTHKNLALSLEKLGKRKEARHHFNEALRLDKNDWETYNQLARFYFTGGQYEQAIQNYSTALHLKPQNVTAYVGLGQIYLKMGQLEAAIPYYQKCLAVDPHNLVAIKDLVKIHFQIDSPEDAADFLKGILSGQPANANLHYELGVTLCAQGKTDEGLRLMEEAVRLDSTNTKAVRALKRQKLAPAFNKIKTQLLMAPNNPVLHYKLGKLFQASENIPQAIAQYTQALSIKPQFVQALMALAYAYVQAQELDQSIGCFEKLARLQPHKPEIYYNLACLHAKQNQESHAIQSLKTAIAKGYNNWELIKTDKDLKNIRDSIDYQNLIQGH